MLLRQLRKLSLTALTITTSAMLALAGCSGDEDNAPVAPTPPKNTVTTNARWDFGTVCSGGTAHRTYSFAVTADADNEGDAEGTIEMDPSSSGPFTIVSGGGPYTLAPGEQKTYEVRFRPVYSGAVYEAIVNVAEGVSMEVEGFGGANPYYEITPTSLNGGVIRTNYRDWFGDNGVSISFGDDVSWKNPSWFTCASGGWIFNGNSVLESKKEFDIYVPHGMNRVAIQLRLQADSDCTQLLIEIDGKEHTYENLSSCATREWFFDITPGNHTIGIGTDQQGALCYADLGITKVRFEFSGRCITDAEWNF